VMVDLSLRNRDCNWSSRVEAEVLQRPADQYVRTDTSSHEDKV
jgi:hypothetical protein